MDINELKAGLEAEAQRVADAMHKLRATFPEPAAGQATDDMVLALGVLWFTFLAAIRERRGDAFAEETKMESLLLASILHPHLVSQKDAFERARRHNALLNTTTKA